MAVSRGYHFITFATIAGLHASAIHTTQMRQSNKLSANLTASENLNSDAFLGGGFTFGDLDLECLDSSWTEKVFQTYISRGQKMWFTGVDKEPVATVASGRHRLIRFPASCLSWENGGTTPASCGAFSEKVAVIESLASQLVGSILKRVKEQTSESHEFRAEEFHVSHLVSEMHQLIPTGWGSGSLGEDLRQRYGLYTNYGTRYYESKYKKAVMDLNSEIVESKGGDEFIRERVYIYVSKLLAQLSRYSVLKGLSPGRQIVRALSSTRSSFSFANSVRKLLQGGEKGKKKDTVQDLMVKGLKKLPGVEEFYNDNNIKSLMKLDSFLTTLAFVTESVLAQSTYDPVTLVRCPLPLRANIDQYETFIHLLFKALNTVVRPALDKSALAKLAVDQTIAAATKDIADAINRGITQIPNSQEPARRLSAAQLGALNEGIESAVEAGLGSTVHYSDAQAKAVTCLPALYGKTGFNLNYLMNETPLHGQRELKLVKNIDVQVPCVRLAFAQLFHWNSINTPYRLVVKSSSSLINFAKIKTQSNGRKGLAAVKNSVIEDALKKELPLDRFCYGPDPGTEANCWGFAACVEAMADAICEKSEPSPAV